MVTDGHIERCAEKHACTEKEGEIPTQRPTGEIALRHRQTQKERERYTGTEIERQREAGRKEQTVTGSVLLWCSSQLGVGVTMTRSDITEHPSLMQKQEHLRLYLPPQ